jgi:hypothetical protein
LSKQFVSEEQESWEERIEQADKTKESQVRIGLKGIKKKTKGRKI